MAPLAAKALSALLLAFLILAVSADDCQICKMSNPTDCDVSGVSLSKGGNRGNQYIDGVTSCAAAYPLVTCGECKNGAGKKAQDCCTLACKTDGKSGQVKAHCLCGPPQSNPGADHEGQESAPGICADPHFRGAFGIQYDFHGVPDRDFNLITDVGLNVNAHFIGQDGTETGFDGTWMSALGFTWSEGNTVRTATITVKQGASAFTEATPFVFEVDGREIHPEMFVASIAADDAVIYQDEGLVIRVAPFAYSYSVQIRDHIELVVTASSHEHPTGNHVDIGISKLNVTATVHGALGQTFAAARAAALKAAVATVGTTDRFDEGDVVEGKDVDYMTSSLLATDSVFNRFRPHAGIFEKINVITRKLLGLTMDSVDESSTEVSCINQVQGGLHCFA